MTQTDKESRNGFTTSLFDCNRSISVEKTCVVDADSKKVNDFLFQISFIAEPLNVFELKRLDKIHSKTFDFYQQFVLNDLHFWKHLSFIFILGSGHSICENAHLFGKTALLKLSMQEMPQKVRKVMPQNRSISVWYLFYSMNLNASFLNCVNEFQRTCVNPNSVDAISVRHIFEMPPFG